MQRIKPAGQLSHDSEDLGGWLAPLMVVVSCAWKHKRRHKSALQRPLSYETVRWASSEGFWKDCMKT
jgi:hypothetical protein